MTKVEYPEAALAAAREYAAARIAVRKEPSYAEKDRLIGVVDGLMKRARKASPETFAAVKRMETMMTADTSIDDVDHAMFVAFGIRT